MTEDVLGMDEAMRLLRKEVANKGADYVYEPVVRVDPDGEEHEVCVYVHHGEPSCLVGHALADFGTDLVNLQIASNESVPATELPDYTDDVSPTAARLFQVAQNVQDNEGTWGEALTAAEAEYRALGGTE